LDQWVSKKIVHPVWFTRQRNGLFGEAVSHRCACGFGPAVGCVRYGVLCVENVSLHGDIVARIVVA
jgi:hypothetical protein